MKRAISQKFYLITLLIICLTMLPGCVKSADQDLPSENTKESIMEQLTANEEVSELTWSPDESAVLYIQPGKSNGSSQVSVWKVNDEARQIAVLNSDFLASTWSPNSKYFLISETAGDRVNSRIFQTDTLQQKSTLESIDLPVFSPDGSSLAYGFEQHNYGDSWGSLNIFHLENGKSELIWKTKNYLYKAASWDEKGNIGYTEINEQGRESQKTTRNIKPSIAGIRLGDSRETVIEKLGQNYTETSSGEDSMNFPEPFDRLTFDRGYEVFIGRDSGAVMEIYATAPEAETNLGLKVGDTAARVFDIYRSEYMEPESIHGGKLYGVFKVEGAAALSFRFDTEPGSLREDIKPENVVISMTLTFPNNMDDDF